MSDRNSQIPRSDRHTEPEIIPPEQGGNRSGGIWISMNERDGTQRVYMARPGPLTIMLGLAILGLIALVMLIVLLSVALIWIPVVIALVLIFALSVYWQRFRARLGRSQHR
jgi:hypothetical protein